MSVVINTNIASITAQNYLTQNTQALQQAETELSSGYQINSAADNAAGLQISQNLTAQINGANQAQDNAQDGNNMLSVADGTLSVVQDNLQRIRELVVQAANGTNGTSNLTAIASEITARIADIRQMTQAAQFNGQNLLQAQSGSTRIQIGANDISSLNTINITSALGSATATGLGMVFSGEANLASNGGALALLGTIDTALNNIGNRRATIGSLQNSLQSAISNLSVTSENLTASNSQILDTNVASESAALAQDQILQQAAATILAQANQSPSIALTLIKGGG
jgi:flagellin